MEVEPFSVGAHSCEVLLWVAFQVWFFKKNCLFSFGMEESGIPRSIYVHCENAHTVSLETHHSQRAPREMGERERGIERDGEREMVCERERERERGGGGRSAS